MTTSELAERLGGTQVGETREAESLVPLTAPRPGGVAVAFDARAAATIGPDHAALAALVVPTTVDIATPCPQIRVDAPRLALARLSALFDRRPRPEAGIDPRAVVAPDARLGAGVSVGPLAVIGAGAVVGAGSAIGASCVVGPGATVGEGCRLHPHVTLYDGVHLGDRVTLHSGVRVGQDGFGYAAGPDGAEKIHHLAGVEIGDDVEVGANTTIDRGALSPTRIGDRSKLGNLCLVAHNVQIGSDCLIAGACALAGSVAVGDRVVLGGGVMVVDHVSVGDDVRVAGHTGLSKDVPAGAVWAGYVGMPYRRFIRERYLIGRLERIWRLVRERA